ncbi:hypothetical protein SPRG_16267 [Saprolegnia parasitica CBS 223.65]|uniref:Ammonium transporter AmtB-like domain-containing protein n=1 Tax=Saprolegnia parasitica (strain CBS 223.65) TaxID=695850 RepID=A0A067BVN7_SAPPC|nr:hypothetical protein SPRG_16267 [Saprolegnia parasitica CBS 223.65]KDO18351.1 hypothetical protein SPRG_16267 [Saprolegnia parasitica CBS 223.65]|eukprot:XP_012210945.1 hypothetical protein SPRG_16267 [Saprolegnia parasitica CBS 223.65]
METTIVIHAPDLAAVWTSMARARETPSADDASLRTVAFHMSLFLVLLLPIGHAMASIVTAASSIQRRSTLYTAGLETAAGIEPATIVCMGVAVLVLVLQLLSAVLSPLAADAMLFHVATGLVLISVLHGTLHLQLPSKLLLLLILSAAGVVYPALLLAAWSDHGWFAPSLDSNGLGVIDMGGLGAVHIPIGAIVLTAMLLLPDTLETAQVHATDPFSILATGLTSIGWPGLALGHATLFLGGDVWLPTLVTIAVHTILASTGGALVGLIAMRTFLPAMDVSVCAFAGFVAGSGSAGLVAPYVALLLGVGGAGAYLAVAKAAVAAQRLRVPSEYSSAVAVHLGAGVFGLLASSVVVSDAQRSAVLGLRNRTTWQQLGANALLALLAVAWSMLIAAVVLVPVRLRRDRDVQSMVYTEMDDFDFDSHHDDDGSTICSSKPRRSEWLYR